MEAKEEERAQLLAEEMMLKAEAEEQEHLKAEEEAHLADELMMKAEEE